MKTWEVNKTKEKNPKELLSMEAQNKESWEDWKKQNKNNSPLSGFG